MLYTVTCYGCEDVYTFSLDPKALEAWQSGVHVQQAFPELSEDERELLISGTCGACWEEMFPEEDEEEEPYSDDYEEWLYEVHGSVLDPESGYPEYESDYYVSESDESDAGQPEWDILATDRDCD